MRTVKPLGRVVDWVVEGRETGEAKPRRTGLMTLIAWRLRRACWKLYARRREAIVTRVWKINPKEKRGGGRGDDGRGAATVRLRFGSQIVRQLAQPIT